MLRVLSLLISGIGALVWVGCSAQFNVPSRLTNKYYLFSAHYAGNSVSSFSVDSSTGKLTLLSTKTVGSGPGSLAVEAGRRTIYVANTGDGTISALSFNTTSGAMSDLQSITTSSGLFAVALHPDGQHLFASIANSPTFQTLVYSIDSIGQLKLVQTLAAKSGFMVTNASGSRLYTSSGLVYSIDSNSTLSLLQDASNADCVQAVGEIAIHPLGGFLYMPCNNNGFKVFKISALDGTLGVSNVYALSGYGITANVTPDGAFVFVTLNGLIHTYSVGSQVDNHTLMTPPTSIAGSYSLATLSGLSFLYFGDTGSNVLRVFPLSASKGFTVTSANNVSSGASPQNLKMMSVALSTKL